jgi:hypothetical protein
MEELDGRLKRYGSAPGDLLSLEELRARIENMSTVMEKEKS